VIAARLGQGRREAAGGHQFVESSYFVVRVQAGPKIDEAHSLGGLALLAGVNFEPFWARFTVIMYILWCRVP